MPVRFGEHDWQVRAPSRQSFSKPLRRHPALQDAVIWKVNDRSTGGIPDFGSDDARRPHDVVGSQGRA